MYFLAVECCSPVHRSMGRQTPRQQCSSVCTPYVHVYSCEAFPCSQIIRTLYVQKRRFQVLLSGIPFTTMQSSPDGAVRGLLVEIIFKPCAYGKGILYFVQHRPQRPVIHTRCIPASPRPASSMIPSAQMGSRRVSTFSTPERGFSPRDGQEPPNLRLRGNK